VLSIPINKKSLLRIENTDSQTRKKRFSRWGNMMNSYDLKTPNKLIDKHILIVDDKVTIGSTLEAYAQNLLEIKGVRK
jgi:predicted amidophosphoribosyltransferase